MSQAYRTKRSAQLSAIYVACISLANSYVGTAGAHGRSVRHRLLLVWTDLEARTVFEVSPALLLSKVVGTERLPMV